MNGFARLRIKFVVYNHHHTPDFDSRAVTSISAQENPTFHTKMEYVWIGSRISQQLDPSNLSL
eukprot:scaffold24008_cov34-Cyclotella_meneghiniana.AAC.1